MMMFGVTSGNDATQHYQFAATVYDALSHGEIYPSFSGNVNNGLGDVGLRFYPPLTYYLMAGSYFIGGDWYFGSLITFFLIFFAGGFGVYLWAREAYDPTTALIAAALFTFAPYHLNQIYNNFLLADFAATSVIPYCLLFASRVINRKSAVDVCGLAAAYGSLILTNLPQAVIGSIVLLLYSLLLLDRERPIGNLAKLAAAAVLGLSISSFYWLRMVTELSWVRLGTNEYFSGIWNYQNNFLFTPQNILGFWDDVLVLWLADLMLLCIILVCLPSLYLWVRDRFASSRATKAVVLMFTFGIFMATPLSSVVWNHLELLQKVQFPWRWLSVITIFGAVLASGGLNRISRILKDGNEPMLQILTAAAFLCFSFTAVFVVKGAVYHPRAEFERSGQSLATHPSCECFWPTWAKQSSSLQSEKVIAGTRTVQISEWTPEARSFEIAPGPQDQALVATYWYPHWRATINGSQVAVRSDASGLISIPLAAGRSQIQLYFDEPTYIKIASFVSCLTVIGLILVALAAVFVKTRLKLPLLN